MAKISVIAGVLLAGLVGVYAADSHASRHRGARTRPHVAQSSVADEHVEYSLPDLTVEARVGDERWRYEVQPYCDGRHLHEVASVTVGDTTTEIYNSMPQDDGIDQIIIERAGTMTTLVRGVDSGAGRQWSVHGGTVDDVAAIVAREQAAMDRMRSALRISERSRHVPERARYAALRSALIAIPSPEHFSMQDGVYSATVGERHFDFRYIAGQNPLLTISDSQGEMMRVAGGNGYLRVFTQGAWMAMHYLPGLPLGRPLVVCHDEERFIRFDIWDVMSFAQGAMRSLTQYFPPDIRR